MTDSDLVYVWCKWKYVEDLQYHLKLAQTLVLFWIFFKFLESFFFILGVDIRVAVLTCGNQDLRSTTFFRN